MKDIGFIINDKHMTLMNLRGNEINSFFSFFFFGGGGGGLVNLRKIVIEMYVNIE